MTEIPSSLRMMLSFRQPQSPTEPGPQLMAAVVLEAEEISAVIDALIHYMDEDGLDAHVASYVLGKLAASLPSGILEPDDGETAPGSALAAGGLDDEEAERHSHALNSAVHSATKVRLTYSDLNAELTERTVWPAELGDYGRGPTLFAWCELRGDFRQFKLDRILRVEVTGETFPQGPVRLFDAYRAAERNRS